MTQLKAFIPVYSKKSGDWSGVTDASQTDRQTTEYRATQLVYSIKFKLSHAIIIIITRWARLQLEDEGCLDKGKEGQREWPEQRK